VGALSSNHNARKFRAFLFNGVSQTAFMLNENPAATPTEGGMESSPGSEKRAGYFRHTQRGVLRLRGIDRLDFFHRISTNDILKLLPLESTGTVLLTDKGRIVDAVRLLNLPDESYLLTGNGAAPKVRSWIDKYTIMEDLGVEDVSHASILISVIEPSDQILHTFTDVSLPKNRIHHCPFGIVNALLNLWDWHGNRVFDILAVGNEQDTAARIQSQLESANVPSMTSDKFEQWRITIGLGAAGQELTQEYNPYEAGLRSLISFTKGCYIGQEIVARLDTYQKIQRKLVLLRFTGAPALLPLPVSLMREGDEVGRVTSFVSQSSAGTISTGLGIVRADSVEVGTSLSFPVDGAVYNCVVHREFLN
jgi:tRNA-modifying protein YgfZ